MPVPLRRRPDSSLLLILAIALCLLAPVSSGDAAVNTPLVRGSGDQISQQQEKLLSASAVQVLRCIAAARADLHAPSGQRPAAGKKLAEAGGLLGRIQAGLPTPASARQVAPDLVPIYTSLNELRGPVADARARASAGSAPRTSGLADRTKAGQPLRAPAGALLYVEADLPLRSTRQLVSQARHALAQGHLKAADQALSRAEDNVVFVSLTIESPLMRAKAALYRAWRDYDSGNLEAARAALQGAVGELEKAAQSQDPVTRRTVGRLVTQVRDLHRLTRSDDVGLSRRLESAWRRVSALSERAVESLSTGWQRYHAKGRGKKELIEARLMLAFARIDHVDAGDNASARVELSEAAGYLKAAVAKMPAADSMQLKSLLSELDVLQRSLKSGKGGAANGASFDRAENTLGKLIHQL